MNNSIETLEIIGVVAIIVCQIVIFSRSLKQITVFKQIFPDISQLTIVKYQLSPHYLELHPRDILHSIDVYVLQSRPRRIQEELVTEDGIVLSPERYEEDNRVSVELIRLKEGGNYVTKKIIYAINTYLIRNRGVASDFHLIKDVVERNTDALEGDIGQSVSLPLYLGLMGTFMGIVLGLYQLSGLDFSGSGNALNDAIGLLLGGVKIAMVASFCGLLFTILNTGIFFRGAKSLVEDKKNDFYTFIQTDLLPLLNQNINSTLYSLQHNLHKFNEEFKGNVGMLSSAMGKNHDALIAQEKILTTLENIDISAFAQANVVILRQLQKATENFTDFNSTWAQANEFVNSAKGYTERLNMAIARTDDFHTLGKQITTVFAENKQLHEFLQSHYSKLEESSQLVNDAVNRVGHTLDESLDKLQTFTQKRMQQMQELVLREFEGMEKELPERWKKLDYLAHLASVDKTLGDIKLSNASQMGTLGNEMKAVNSKMAGTLTVLEKISEKREGNLARISASLTNLFKKKKSA